MYFPNLLVSLMKNREKLGLINVLTPERTAVLVKLSEMSEIVSLNLEKILLN